MPQLKINKKRPVILSVGGSLIVPSVEPDAEFLKKFDDFISPRVKRGQKFVIVCGGGKTARHYIESAKKIHHIEPDDLDWIGIHATRLNGHLMRTIFRKFAHPVVIKNPMRTPKVWQGKILVAAGWKPGWSTDYVACRIAKRLGAASVINMSNIDYVFDSDPSKNPKAKKIETMAWSEYRKMVGDKWDPGLSAPFDPVASRFCHKNKITVAIANGRNIKNLGELIEGKEFKGTILTLR